MFNPPHLAPDSPVRFTTSSNSQPGSRSVFCRVHLRSATRSPSKQPVEIDPDEATRAELAEALEHTRREVYELEQELTTRIQRLKREIERLN